MKLNELEKQKLGRKNSWQQVKPMSMADET